VQAVIPAFGEAVLIAAILAHPPSPATVTRHAPATAAPDRKPSGAHRLTGVSTWYRYRTGQAAAGPRLREALGRGWRGRTVWVCGISTCTGVRLTDYMGTHNRAKVIDLDDGLFRRICGPLSRGVCRVTVAW
jgi:hypothetical protein